MKRVFAIALAGMAFSASAQDFYPSAAMGGLSSRGAGFVEARFRADATNWDTRLAFDGTPVPGQTTGGVGNGRSAFENQSFGFDLNYTAATSTFGFVITRPDLSTSGIDLQASDITQLNTIHMYTTGSRSPVTLTGLEFNGGAFAISAFPNIDTQPGGTTFRETFLFLGESTNLTGYDWSLSGQLAFGAFTHNNPSEGAKLTIRVVDAVPTPGTAGILAAAGLFSARRRR